MGLAMVGCSNNTEQLDLSGTKEMLLKLRIVQAAIQGERLDIEE